MVKRRNSRDEEEEEKETLITAKVVEYLEPVMSRDLLCKFPDNSALGFDYSQSSLWSPLLPRNHGRPLDLEAITCSDFSLELGEETNTMKKKKKKKKKVKNKFLGFDVSATKKKKKNKKIKSGFSTNLPKLGCFAMRTKGWDGMLKAASKHFKKTNKKKKMRESIGDVKLLDYFKR